MNSLKQRKSATKHTTSLLKPLLIVIFLLVTVTTGGCAAGKTGGAPDGKRDTGTGAVTGARFSAANSDFAEYREVPVHYTPSVTMEPVKDDLSNVENFYDYYLEPEEVELLKKNLFVIKPSGDYKFSQLYEHSSLPVFISSDVVLHAYHKVFAGALIQSEKTFFKELRQLTATMLHESVRVYQEARDEELKEAARRNIAYFGVAAKLLGMPVKGAAIPLEVPMGGFIKRASLRQASVLEVPSDVENIIDAELALIEKHGGYTDSPLFNYEEDYSHFIPRGHYTVHEDATRYFKAMVWYGRMNFSVRLNSETPPSHDGHVKRRTRQALLIVRMLEETSLPGSGKETGRPALYSWRDIYEPTAFFAGYSDDLNVYDYAELAHDVFGKNITDRKLADDSHLNAFIAAAQNARKPKISSTGAGLSPEDEMGFKFMGQRFVPDSYIFQELVFPKTGRKMPKGLDIAATLGSKRAYAMLDTTYDETKDAAYVKQMAALKKEFAALKKDTWTQNLYWGWLYSLTALFKDAGKGYPPFMRSTTWQNKSVNTFLGSWTELRHDTVLYAKESVTLRGIAEGPPEVNGYVEPNPELYARLLALTRMTKNGLKKRGLLEKGGQLEGRIDELSDLLAICKSVSEKELSNKPISYSENTYFKGFHSTLKWLEQPISEPDDPWILGDEAPWQDAIVVDVHTDSNSETCLEEAVGTPMEIFVIAPVNGKPVFFKGGAFSHYEFTKPISERMTDEDWQGEGTMFRRNPKLPTWYKSFTALPADMLE